MNIITNTGIRNISIALAALISLALFVAITPKAQAADYFGDSYDFYPMDSGYSGMDSYDFYPMDSGYSGMDSYDFYPMDSGFSDFSGFSGGGFGGGMGGFSMPFSGGGNYQSQNQSQAQSQAQSSNNTNVNNNVITIGAPIQADPLCPSGTSGIYPNCVWPQPTPTYDICSNIPGIQSTLPAGYYIQNGYCYQNYVQPVVYQQPPVQPYVTLAAVPYTGLELGTMGTVAYWGFLVLWCLIAAYLIVVKKVQNKIAAWFTGSTPAHTAHVAHAPVARALYTAPKAAPLYAGIDPFIQSQINRAK